MNGTAGTDAPAPPTTTTTTATTTNAQAHGDGGGYSQETLDGTPAAVFSVRAVDLDYYLTVPNRT